MDRLLEVLNRGVKNSIYLSNPDFREQVDAMQIFLEDEFGGQKRKAKEVKKVAYVTFVRKKAA